MLVLLAHLPRRASITSISGRLGACSFGLLKELNLHTFKSPKEHAPRGPLMLVMLAHLPRNNIISERPYVAQQLFSIYFYATEQATRIVGKQAMLCSSARKKELGWVGE